MQRETAQLGPESMSCGARLPPRHPGGNHDVTQEAWLRDRRAPARRGRPETSCDRKRQDIGRAVDPPEATIERPHLSVADQRHRDLATRRAAGRNVDEPPAERLRPHGATSAIGDGDTQRLFDRHGAGDRDAGHPVERAGRDSRPRLLVFCPRAPATSARSAALDVRHGLLAVRGRSPASHGGR